MLMHIVAWLTGKVSRLYTGFMMRWLCLLLLILTQSACSSLGVEPWERGILSQPDMQFGSNNVISTLSQHFYFSKEASSGGQGFAGGGCGCN